MKGIPRHIVAASSHFQFKIWGGEKQLKDVVLKILSVDEVNSYIISHLYPKYLRKGNEDVLEFAEMVLRISFQQGTDVLIYFRSKLVFS